MVFLNLTQYLFDFHLPMFNINYFTARYIIDENDYLARILHDHCDDKDNFALWIIVLTTRRTVDEIKALDSSFQKAYEGVTLKNYILVTILSMSSLLDMFVMRLWRHL